MPCTILSFHSISSTLESLMLFFEGSLKFQVFADMEELGVKPDEDTVRRVARAFQMLGQEDKHKLVVQRYQSKWNMSISMVKEQE